MEDELEEELELLEEELLEEDDTEVRLFGALPENLHPPPSSKVEGP